MSTAATVRPQLTCKAYNVCVTCMCMNVHVYERYIQCTVYIHMYVSECVREAEWVGVGCGRRG